MTELIARLLLAHLLGDFVLQPTPWVAQKERRKAAAPLLYLHAAVHGLLAFLFTFSVAPWSTGLWVAGIHLLIDLLKLYKQKPQRRTEWFLADQALHLLSLLLIAFCIRQPSFEQIQTWFGPSFWVVAAGLIAVSFGAGTVIQIALQRWTPVLGTGPDESLSRAGKYIGILERTMTFLFILANHWEAVGFLIAAKSIFRFGDLQAKKDIKLTEYILVGSLLSFGIAVVTGLLVKCALHQPL